MKELCDNCGKMSDILYELFYRREHLTNSQKWKFCYECGTKLEALIKEGFQ